jgi:hypothetical protein
MKFQFGQICAELSGNHPAAELLQAEYLPLKVEQKSEPNFVLEILNYNDISIPKNAKEAEGVYSTDNKFIVDSRRHNRFSDIDFLYSWSGDPYNDEFFKLTAYCDPRYIDNSFAKLFSYFRRLRDWNYLFPIDRVAKNLIYNLIEPFLNIYMLKYGQSFFHGAGVYDNDGGIIFTGWGGAGKTATSLRLALEHDFKLLSDDLIIIDKNKDTYMYPKRMQVYAYNVEGFEKLYKILMRKRGIIDKTHWQLFKLLHGRKGVRRRVHLHEIVSTDKIGPQKTKIKKIYYLLSKNGGEIEITEATAKTIAKSSRAVIKKELWSVFKFFNALEAITEPKISLAEILNKNEELYTKILSDIDCSMVYVPKGTNPTKLTEAVLKDL